MNAKRGYRHMRLRLAIITAIAMFTLLSSSVASAHPLGNFTINRYSRITQIKDRLEIVYLIDMAEIPAHAERRVIDVNGNGVLTAAELASYRGQKAAELLRNLALSINDAPTTFALDRADLDFPLGQAGLPTLRLRIEASIEAPAAGFALAFTDNNYAGRLGWSEVVIRGGDGWRIDSSTAPAEDVSSELTKYPVDLLTQPLAVNTAIAHFTPGVANSAPPGVPVMRTVGLPQMVSRATDPFADLVAIPDLHFVAILAALLAALGWGALHALSPGHGKTIVAAYLVGARGTAWHALFLGLTTTITHTAGVFVLGAAALLLSHYFLPEQLFPWLSALSGFMVVIVGLSLIKDRLESAHDGKHSHPELSDHQHGSEQDHARSSDIDHNHFHSGAHVHHHDHHHGQDHHHGHDHHHRHGHNDTSRHTHSHLPLDVNGRSLSWRGLLALGITGGLLPCPSALVLMLGAISLNRVAFGLMLILAFSAGLAGVLTVIGVVLLRARWFFERLPERGWLLQWAPVGSAVFIIAAGLVITVQALAQTGLLFG